MSMTYCKCQKCGTELLLDDSVIEARGYICDDCAAIYGTQSTKPCVIMGHCPICESAYWNICDGEIFQCMNCKARFSINQMNFRIK